ncbi:MAG: ethanolamine ammonia-lyase subunit EutC [Acidobacteriaceae bacterium]|nr:ethanolamine ammonia-lyase subunit EutC [Acidobacteriaceae bacterium]
MISLGQYTCARVSLGLAGDSLPTRPLLDYRLAHARARDAVHFPLDAFSLSQELKQRNWSFLATRSAAKNRDEYLRHPDKGRTLDAASATQLAALSGAPPFVFVIADGLSAIAIQRHAIPLLDQAFAALKFIPNDRNPIILVEQGRVAIGDHIGELLRAELSVVLIGERPGLSAPDSLGVYLTWNPKRGRTDAERNCISNIHAQGLSYDLAARKLAFLINEARRRKLTGIGLKETAALPEPGA